MKKYLFLFNLILSSQILLAEKPKLVVGIVVDQMKNEYIIRFWDKYSKNGFKLLVEEGYWCKNTHYNYFPTYTGPGHASIYTGTTPSNHGIVANDWYDKTLKRTVYCTEDKNMQTLGSLNESGKMSPNNMVGNSICDQLKLSSNMQSKVIGISLKDRGAILPAGHLADMAYWFDSKSGNFISSTYYSDTLPNWVVQFNKQQKADEYLNQTWSTLLPIFEYKESLPDNNPYETILKGKQIPTFPYPLARIRKNYPNYDLIKYTPFGNTLVTEFSLQAIYEENLGKDSITDFLCISYSSTDYIGHEFGPRSIELEDTYLRLDIELEGVFKYLDDSIGYGNYMVFLTSDHGAAENSIYLSDQKINAGIFNSKFIVDSINQYLKHQDTTLLFNPAQYYINHQIYIHEESSLLKELDKNIYQLLTSMKGVSDVWHKNDLRLNTISKNKQMYLNGFYPKRSGDIFIHLLPGWTEYKTTGCTHGSIYSYDTHVPLLFYGKDIPYGSTNRKIEITDIAKTLALYLYILEPDACSGKPIEEILIKKE